MISRLYFLLILLFRNYKQYLSISIISILYISILFIVLFISSSIQKDIYSTLKNQADFTVERYKSSRIVDAPIKWVDEFLEIDGVSIVEGRVYGRYFYEQKDKSFLIVGVDFYDNQVTSTLQKLVDSVDIDKFLSKNSMIIGAGVKDFFDEFAYFDYYIFRPPDRSKVKVYIYDVLPKDSSLITNDMIIVDKDLARKILDIDEDFVSDIVLNVINEDEKDKIYEKLIISHFNSRIITKDDIFRYYKKLFNYKRGIFLIFYIFCIITFLMILYQRYSMVKDVDKKEVAILKSIGWSIERIIYFKLLQNIIVIVFSYMIGFIFAYIYVFYFNAPIFRDIFLNDDNLVNNAIFTPYINFLDMFMLFVIFVIPFLLSIFIPLWKVATTQPYEILR